MVTVTARLEGWATDNDRYYGFVYDDILKRFKDGTYIHTSKIDHVEDNLVFTKSRNVYQLGEPFVYIPEGRTISGTQKKIFVNKIGE